MQEQTKKKYEKFSNKKRDEKGEFGRNWYKNLSEEYTLKLKLEDNGLKASVVIPPFFPNKAVLTRKCALNKESSLIGGGRGSIVWNVNFSPFCCFGGELGLG